MSSLHGLLLQTFKMNGNVNLLKMSYNDINCMKKRLRGANWEKVVFDSHVKDLCNLIERLTESLNQVTAANKRITSELVIVKKC